MNIHHYDALDETVCRRVLPCGLTVQVVPRRGFAKKLAYLAVNAGAIHSDFRLEGQEYHLPAGVAHYLEHKLFDMPDGTDVSEDFARLGAMSNAFTGYDMTAYYFSTTEHYAECLGLLLQFVTTPYFTEESVEKERGIIEQEIAMNRDDPGSMGFEALMAAMYPTHAVRTPILGTAETIGEITPQMLRDFHRAFYAPGNLLLTVIGDVDAEQTCAIAQEILGDTPLPVGEKLRPWDEKMTVPTKETVLSMDIAMPAFHLAFKAEPLGTGAESVKREFLGDLACEVLFGESSQLYLRLYESGLIDSSFGGGFETLDGCAMVLCGGDSDDPKAVIAAVLEEAERISAAGISETDFLRLQRSALGRRIRGLDSFDSTCFRLCAYHFSEFDYLRFPEVSQSITPQELVAFLKTTIRAERCGLCVVEPLHQSGR